MNDEMKLVSKFLTGMVSKIIGKLIKKKVGYDINVNINELKAVNIEGKTRVHLDIDAEISKEELTKILKSVDLF